MSVFAAIVSASCDDAAPVTTAPREKQAIPSRCICGEATFLLHFGRHHGVDIAAAEAWAERIL